MRNRYARTDRTKSLTWWANDKPQVESLLKNLLARKRVQPNSLLKKRKTPGYFVAISYYEHGHAEDFHFGRTNPKDGSIRYELDLTRIEAHGRKQRLNCAMEESKQITADDLGEVDLVSLKESEYRTLRDTVVRKLH